MRATYYNQVANGGGGCPGSTAVTYHQGGSMKDDTYVKISLRHWKELQEQLAEQGISLGIREKDTGTTLLEAPEVSTKDGMTFTTVKRAGDETKNRYLDHVHEMFAQGYLSEKEHDARVDAIMAALTEKQMAFCIRDLPGLPDIVKAKPAVTRKPAISRQVTKTALLGMAAGLIIASFIFSVTFPLVIASALILLSNVSKWLRELDCFLRER